MIVQSDLQSKSLKPVAAGHRVNGVAVCVGVSHFDIIWLPSGLICCSLSMRKW